MIEIDGSHGEGGGQIIRTSVALSAITGKPVSINNIRANRPNPGLQAQHLEAVKAVAKLCGAKTDAKLGATSLSFHPGSIEGGHFVVNIGTAGAISLIIQSIALPSIHAEKPVTMKITGGTHVRWSPSMDYMTHVFSYFMEKMGIGISLGVEKYGFYPKGGGIVNIKIDPSIPRALNIEKRGKKFSCNGISLASEDLRKTQVAERQFNGAEKFVNFDDHVVKYVTSLSPGSAIYIQQSYENCVLGAQAIGDKGVSASAVGAAAGSELKKQVESEACIDEHMTDQVLPFLAFARGNSRIKVADITDHARSNIWVIEKFLPAKFHIDEKKKIIEVRK